MSKIVDIDGRFRTLEETMIWSRTHFINPRKPEHTLCGFNIKYGRYRNNTHKKEDVTCRPCLNRIKEMRY